MADAGLPRNQWSMGRIWEMLRSSDGRFRAARILIEKYRDNSVTRLGAAVVERPTSKLIKLLSADA